MVGNGFVFVIINGNLCIFVGLLYKDVSLCDNELCILLSSFGYELKCDMIVIVESGDIIVMVIGVCFCCLVFCYCESNYCDSYKELCIWRIWYGMCFYVCLFVEYKYFEWFILVMIVISSLILVSFYLCYFFIIFNILGNYFGFFWLLLGVWYFVNYNLFFFEIVF